MKVLRRLLQVVALVGTLLIGIVAMALIVSQTPWFRDWLRGYIVRQAGEYLHGELSIGRLGGNLFFGVNLDDVRLTDPEGEPVVTANRIEVEYSVFEFISQGVVVNEIRLEEPFVRVVRDEAGQLNLGRIVREQRREADREGPGRPIEMQSITVEDGTVLLVGEVAGNGVRLPDRIDALDVRAAFHYEPVRYTVELEHVSFRGTSPALTLHELSGTVAVRDDDVHLDSVAMRTAESNVEVEGVIEQYTGTPVLRLGANGRVSLPEIARIVPALAGYEMRPAFDVRASGPAEKLDLNLDVRSEAGNVRGQVTADVRAPGYGVAGELDVERLNLAPILRDPEQRSDITGRANVDLRIAERPAAAPVADRLAGTFAFAGPRVVAGGWEATDVRATGAIDGPRLDLEADAVAYGGSATARGHVILPSERRPLAFDLRGRARNLDLRNLPARTGAPAMATNLSIAEYHVRGEGQTITGSALLDQSAVEGATFAQGTVAEFGVRRGEVSYAARGAVQDLDLARFGRTLDIAALAEPRFESRINAQFDVTGAGTELATLALEASGTLTDSALMGGRVPEMTFDVALENGGLRAEAKGSFRELDVARLAGREDLEGTATGVVDARFNLADLAEPVTPETVAADGRIVLEDSTIRGVAIHGAEVDATYAGQVAEVRQLQVAGPDVNVQASGRLALNRTDSSHLTYRVEAAEIAELSELAGVDDVSGGVILDGTVTGNLASFTTTGVFDGSNVAYQEQGALDLNGRYAVTVPELEFAEARAETTVEATFVRVGGFEMNRVTADVTYAKQRLDFVANVQEEQRELDAAGGLILHTDHQELHLQRLAVRAQGIEWHTDPGSEATINYAQNRIEIDELRLVSFDQTLEVSGTIAMNAEAPEGVLEVEAANVDLQQIETLLLQDRGLHGRLSAEATIGGTTADPRVDATVQVRDGAFQDYRYQALDATVQYTGERLELDARLQQSPAESITARGTVPMTLFQRADPGHIPPTNADRVDLHIQSTDLGLGLVQGFTDAITNVAGTLRAEVHVTGSGADPHFEGFVDIRNGAFAVPAAGTSYRGLDTRIHLDDDVVRIERFQILDENGAPMTVWGELAVHALEVGAVNINIESQGFEILDNELGDIGVDTQLRITGELRRPVVKGDVRLQTGRVRIDRLLALFYDPYAVEALPEVQTAEQFILEWDGVHEATGRALARAETGLEPFEEPVEPEEPPAPGGIFEPLALDVRVRIPDNLVLRGSDVRPGGPTGASIGDVNVTLGGDVRVQKAPGEEVLLVGVVNTVRGTYEFQGRRFNLVRGGTIRFVGTPEINPLLDVTATRVIPRVGVEAQVRITGTAQDPELALTSNPPLDESDILALIIFNRPVNELGTGERASLAATAGGIATGFVAAPLGEAIGRALDLDLFEITTTTEEGDLGAGIVIGQQFGDRAFVQLRQQFGEQSISEFMLEYQLADFLRLQATAAPETAAAANRILQRRVERAGVDLIFFFSY